MFWCGPPQRQGLVMKACMQGLDSEITLFSDSDEKEAVLFFANYSSVKNGNLT